MHRERPPNSVADVACVLVGGRSHAGKSTVASHLADRFGWEIVSTDRLGRHPGRPWGTVPSHVVAHYTTLDEVTILDALVTHQRGMWPQIDRIVRERLASGLVLEGSAIMPKQAVAFGLPAVAAVWLTGSDPFFRRRIEAESGYAEADAPARHLIDRFIQRNQRLDALLREEAELFNLPLVDVEGQSAAELAEACLTAMKRLS